MEAPLRHRWTSLLATVAALLFGGAAPSLADESRDPPCAHKVFEASSFTVCAFDSRRQDMRMLWTDAKGKPLRSFGRLADALGQDSSRIRFAMNAGMYEQDGSPVGLYVENRVERHPLNTRDADGNFYLKPNGVFSLGGADTVRIDAGDTFLVQSDRPLFATQSGPMLVIGGKLHPRITDDGPSKNIRNGVGLRDAHTALFVISDEPVSFGRLARFFRDGLGCQDALYLDGKVSSLWVPAQGRRVGGSDIGPMVVILDKP
jgi:uncharacterized protein YigE (DUF2233 family)